MRWLVLAIVIAPLSAFASGAPSASGPPPVAPAPSSSVSALELARRLFVEGRQLFEEGDYAGAYQKFGQAAQLKNTPQIRINIARCLEKLGYLISAVEELRGAAADAKKVSNDPVEKLATELANAIEPKIAFLTVKADPQTAKVVIDGIVGSSRKLDPGDHVVTVTGTKTVTTKITLKEGEKRTLIVSAK